MRRLLLLLGVFGALASAQSYRVVDARGKVVEVRSVERIVSLDGITTEILFALGVGEKVVGRDDSSYYPPEAQRLPSVGYQFRLSAEGILSLKPTLVIGREDVRPKEVVEQLERAGVAVVLVPTEPSVEGAKAKIRTVAQAVGRVEQGEALVRALERDLLLLRAFQAQHAAKGKLRALFLYLRGPGTTFVCGEGSTPVGVMELAGLENAAKGIRECQPMTAESVVAARPEVIVVFKKGLESVGGLEGLLKLPGVAQTPAGQKRKVVAMDDLYLGSFGPRAGRAALDLFRAAYLQEGFVEVGP
ncbi:MULTISPECIES: heme/hemin ABC transporter substrate-binding protein [Thermus]|jgi:iron complex transport system substrate-binding protein|uniref:Hemin ABC transporter, periplasmic hemin-binding protein n=1 Tax=Thermus thermophilus (strain ATCC 27634 / DSM 579 / HB8) TaxID=300852 RepID=Q53VV9_THET8|nr:MULTISPECIES: hemin ABC transporter substrate-binding protein [Thermus]QZY59689.1 hemin ABC transporter substrate-binding protein [Thermus thermophilus]BAD72016.1 hemin ABC transporter, periplasmic hemin-binding protein [Thermus thermophilus HB8]BCP98069.1 hemin ABC transporter substrate-binding protein [Thermus thermophilus]BCQ00400.1 hemin ABC transporter substrate-binding protein [Thermus thermophilus]BDA38648.1 hemin ABC transporter substrate-binding protein [Thermus thermophilus]